jgi:flagellar hook-length control protein FliK
MLATSLGGAPPPARRGPKAAPLPSIEAAAGLRYSELLLADPSCRDAALRCAAAPALLAALQAAAASAVAAGAGEAVSNAIRAAGKAAMHSGLARGGDAAAAADAVAQLLAAAVTAAAEAPEEAAAVAGAPKAAGKRKARAAVPLEDEAPPQRAVAAALETALQLAVRPSRGRCFVGLCACSGSHALLFTPLRRLSARRWGCWTPATTAP